MIAYKLFRVLKDGSITSLYINKSRKLPLNEWLEAESFPTKGFKVRPYWHCVSEPEAPHLSMKGREWYQVDIKDWEEFGRPKVQGGLWYLAKRIKILNKL